MSTNRNDELSELYEEREHRLRYPPCNLPPDRWSISLSLLADDLKDDRTWIEAIFNDESEAEAVFQSLNSPDYLKDGLWVAALWSPEDDRGCPELMGELVVTANTYDAKCD